MGTKNVELSSIIPFREDDRWYLKLIYKYDDENNNKHMFIIPKASLPFDQRCIPPINWIHGYIGNLAQPYINCKTMIVLHNAVYTPESEPGEAKMEGIYFDIVTEHAAKEITLADIEKELGYKVKIVDRENK